MSLSPIAGHAPRNLVDQHKRKREQPPLPRITTARFRPAAPLNPKRIKKIETNATSSFGVAQQKAARCALKKFSGHPHLQQSDLQTKYNIELGAATDQKDSGRCWIFAGLNAMFLGLANRENYGKEFQYSQNFISFYDKLERANHFLETISQFHTHPIESPETQGLLHLFHEGGYWETFVNIVEKYGIVPADAMPETHDSTHSDNYINLLTERLRTAAGVIHQKLQAIALLPTKTAQANALKEVRAIKDQALTETYRILVVALGSPPKKVWVQNEEEKLVSMTPLEFYQQTQNGLKDKVALSHLPYLPSNRHIVATHVGNVQEGRRVRVFNSTLSVMKQAARASIKAGQAVVIYCSMKGLDRQLNLLSLKNDPATLFELDPSISLSKGKELQYKAQNIAHSMALVGCDDARKKGLGPLWKVENSWKGARTIYMTDEWFDRYCYEIIVDKAFLPKRARQNVQQEKGTVYVSAFDPLGCAF